MEHINHHSTSVPGFAAPDAARNDEARGEAGQVEATQENRRQFAAGPLGAQERAAILRRIAARYPGATVSAQRRALRTAFREVGPINSWELSRHLGLYDPRARVRDLRRDGATIVTAWTLATDELGSQHRIALYQPAHLGKEGAP